MCFWVIPQKIGNSHIENLLKKYVRKKNLKFLGNIFHLLHYFFVPHVTLRDDDDDIFNVHYFFSWNTNRYLKIKTKHFVTRYVKDKAMEKHFFLIF